MESREITIALTSCGRFDLLEKTVQSLVRNWDGPKPKDFYIYDDSELSGFQKDRLKNILKTYLDFYEWPVSIIGAIDPRSTPKIGQIKAIDRLYSRVLTPYIFHCEDDWEFTKSGFIEKSLDILESDPKIMQVWIRKPNDRNGHPAFGGIKKANDGTHYQLMSPNFAGGKFRGFSFNPGLRRLSDYQLIGPYSEITTFDPKQPLKSEIAVGQAYFRKNFRAATLLDGYCEHIGGNGRHING
jgi:hypothetical protein